ncbi:hypothetical protein [Amycolatopsis sp. NPDC051128]|uniref:hypothetical protein n=1 Tax=Amycolatopsis sp. NPDC051128 TaxID=3155412 RepID=UPI003442AF80
MGANRDHRWSTPAPVPLPCIAVNTAQTLLIQFFLKGNNQMLNRIGPELDLRELDENQLHEIKNECYLASVNPEENRITRIFYGAVACAVDAEVTYRVLSYSESLNVPDHL